MQQKIAQKPSLDFIMKSDFDRQPYIAPICNALDMETDSELFVCTPVTPNKVWQTQASARQPPDLVNSPTEQMPNIDLASNLDKLKSTWHTSPVKPSNYILQNHPSPSTLSRKAKADKMAKNSKTMIA